jgi:hypothetical protein
MAILENINERSDDSKKGSLSTGTPEHIIIPKKRIIFYYTLFTRLASHVVVPVHFFKLYLYLC